VSSIVFDGDGLTASLLDEDIHLPYDAAVMGVYCKPPSGFFMQATVDASAAVERGDGPAVAEGIQWMSRLDLYFGDPDAPRRVTIVPDLADFSSLGPLRASSVNETMASILGECRERFGRLHLDTRHMDVRPRSRFVMGEAGFDPDMRKRYSFGTLLLCHVLESISPELRDVPQYELGSRMAYALRPLGDGSG
jgi:hypothetical protein